MFKNLFGLSSTEFVAAALHAEDCGAQLLRPAGDRRL